MRLKELTLVNFRKHKKLKIEFQNQTVITGDNGNGKTSVLEAIGIVLFDSPRTTLKDTIRQGESYCTISIIFSHLEKEYRVRRSYGNVVEYVINDSITGKEACTAFLRNLFQIDGNVWENVICLSQFSKRFPFDLPLSERTSIINRLIGVGKYEQAWEWLRDVANTGKEAIKVSEIRLGVATNSVEEWSGKRAEWTEQLEFWLTSPTIPDEVGEAFRFINQHRDEMSKPAVDRVEFQRQVDAYTNALKGYAIATSERKRLGQKLALFEKGFCPTCGQPVDTQKIVLRMESTPEPVKPTPIEMPERFRSEEIDSRYAQALSLTAGFTNDCPTNSVAEAAIAQLENNLSLIPKHDLEFLRKDYEVNKMALGMVEKERLALKKAMADIPDRARTYLEQKAFQFIEGVFPFTSLTLDPGYAILVNGEIPLSSLSGAESVMVVMAFRLALNLLVSNNLGLLVLDEPTDALDKERKAKMVELVNNFPGQVIIVTHDDCFQESIRI